MDNDFVLNTMFSDYNDNIPSDNNQNEYEKEFQDFLAQQMELKNNDAVIDEETANYYVGRIKHNKNKQSFYENRAKSIIEDYKEKVKLWSTGKIESIEKDTEYCTEKLRVYYEAQAEKMRAQGKDPSKLKLDFPEGKVGFYGVRGSTKIDNPNAVLEFIETLRKENNDASYMQDCLKTEITLDNKAFLAQGKVEDGVFKINGIAAPGVTVTPATTKFSVR